MQRLTAPARIGSHSIYVDYKHDDWSFGLYCRNFRNEKYLTCAAEATGGGAAEYEYGYGAPLTRRAVPGCVDGSADPTRADIKRDARGMAVKVLGVPGKKLLQDEEDATTQDFIMISHPVGIRGFRIPCKPATGQWFLISWRLVPLATSRFESRNTMNDPETTGSWG
jgi:hypothetical protein